MVCLSYGIRIAISCAQTILQRARVIVAYIGLIYVIFPITSISIEIQIVFIGSLRLRFLSKNTVQVLDSAVHICLLNRRLADQDHIIIIFPV
jgi:hypothetical protein